ncbi:MAG TPA: hypothetical protein VNZ24_04860, partial [Vicinamibacterales bacterium]|nr:hypothetical protein [Vicinamibacterales bacterium]
SIEPRSVADPFCASFMETDVATVLPAPVAHKTLHASHNVVESCLVYGWRDESHSSEKIADSPMPNSPKC